MNVLYTKTSDYRSEKFNLKTEIVEIKGNRFARKSAQNIESEGHIEQIYGYHERLKEIFEPEYEICPVKKDASALLFDYIDGKSYEELLAKAVKNSDVPVIWSLIDSYNNLVSKMYTYTGFQSSPEFETVFGKLPDDPNLEVGSFVDVDVIFSNIISRNKLCLIDYEWCFDFPIPIKYVFWKGLFTSKAFSKIPRSLRYDIYEKYGLSDEQRQQFLSMEEHFVNYAKGKRLSFADETSQMGLSVIGYDQIKLVEQSYPIAFFSVKNDIAKRVYEGVSHPGNNSVDFTIKDDYDRLEMFVAPVQSVLSGIIVISIDSNGKHPVPFETTSEADNLETRYFIKNTPVIIIKEKCRKIRVEFKVDIWNAKAFEDEIFSAYLNSIDFVSDRGRIALDEKQQQLEHLSFDLSEITLKLEQKSSELQQINSELQLTTSKLTTTESKLSSLETEYNNTMATLRRKNIFKAFLYLMRLRKD